MFTDKETQDLLDLRILCDDLYYNEGKSPLSDIEYDMLVRELSKRGITCQPIGAKIGKNDVPVKLPVWMGSLNKIKDSDEAQLARWLKKYPVGGYLIEPKLDGISALLVCNGGKMSMYTRGDGKIGADITHVIRYIRNIPLVTENIMIRGELVMNTNTFKVKYASEYSNPRNFVAGRLSGKTVRDGLGDIRFVAYEVVSNISDAPLLQLRKMATLGFEVPKYNVVDNLSISDLTSQFMTQTCDYDIDGLVVQTVLTCPRNTSGNPEYAFAYKIMFMNLTETVIEEVEWNESKWGTLKPRIRVDPVNLCGVTITYATAFNAKFVMDNSIGPGTVIKLTRSGDVIPFIAKVVRSTTASMPSVPYTWSASGVDAIIDTKTTTSLTKRISFFFKTLKIKHVSDATVSKLLNNGYDSVLKIVSADKEDFASINGFQDRLAERTYDNIHTGLQDISLATLLTALGVFGAGLGQKKIEVLVESVPDLLTTDRSKQELVALINSVEGFSDLTTEKVISNLGEARDLVEELEPYITFVQPVTKGESLAGLKFVFSGFRDDSLEAFVKANGGKIVSSVSSGTTAVVTNDLESMSSKLVKARDLGIPVLDKDQFETRYVTSNRATKFEPIYSVGTMGSCNPEV